MTVLAYDDRLTCGNTIILPVACEIALRLVSVQVPKAFAPSQKGPWRICTDELPVDIKRHALRLGIPRPDDDPER